MLTSAYNTFDTPAKNAMKQSTHYYQNELDCSGNYSSYVFFPSLMELGLITSFENLHGLEQIGFCCEYFINNDAKATLSPNYSTPNAYTNGYYITSNISYTRYCGDGEGEYGGGEVYFFYSCVQPDGLYNAQHSGIENKNCCMRLATILYPTAEVNANMQIA